MSLRDTGFYAHLIGTIQRRSKHNIYKRGMLCNSLDIFQCKVSQRNCVSAGDQIKLSKSLLGLSSSASHPSIRLLNCNMRTGEQEVLLALQSVFDADDDDLDDVERHPQFGYGMPSTIKSISSGNRRTEMNDERFIITTRSSYVRWNVYAPSVVHLSFVHAAPFNCGFVSLVVIL